MDNKENFDKVNEPQFVVLGIENLMPQRDIEMEDGNKYRVYLEEKVRDTDRCFGISSTDDPRDIKLFQITTGMDSNKNFSMHTLAELDITNDEVAKYLLINGLEIVNDLRNKGMDVKMTDFSKTIAVGNQNYILTYQPPTAEPINMRQQYIERVTRRIYR